MRGGMIVALSALLKLHTLLNSLQMKEKTTWKLLHFSIVFGKSTDDPVPKGCLIHFTKKTIP